MNPRQMQQAMRRMGIQQQDIDAEKVVIYTKDKEIIFNNPQVAKVNMMGQYTYQVIGETVEKNREIQIDEEDIQTVMDQTNVDRERVLESIRQHDGDLAAAIMELQEN